MPVRRIAAGLGVDESTLRYRLSRAPDTPDGRRDRPSLLGPHAHVVEAVLERFGDGRVVEGGGPARCAARTVYDVLVREYGFTGSYQTVRRHLKRCYGEKPVRAVRRVETPPGVQAQHDWFEWKGSLLRRPVTLYGLIGTLSHSRATFVWVSRSMDQLAWQAGHLALFERYGGVPLWVRIDNLKTAVASGAGPTAVLTKEFDSFARASGFLVDPCRPATGSDKGKVERQVRTDRGAFADLLRRDWTSLEGLQSALDERSEDLNARRRCPTTGTSVAEAHSLERRLLRELPAIQEPFDCVVARRVSRDCLVSFEGRRYSVPFAWVGRTVEVRGTARHVVAYGSGVEIARHVRRTESRLVLVDEHYEGSSTSAVLAPTPLGARAREQLAARLWTLEAIEGVARPVSRYAEMVDAAVGGKGGVR